MKQRLLSFAVIATLALTAFAQTTWTPPAFVPDASMAVELKSSETDTVYLYNVGAEQFLVGGTTWGTHAAIGTSGLPIRLTSNASDAWTIYFFEGSKSQQILGRSTASDLYIDYNNQSGWCTTFTFTKVGDYYRIQSNINDATYGQEAFPDTYVGQVPTREDFDKDNNSIGFGVGVWGDVKADEPDAHIDWLIISKAAFKAYNDLVTTKQQLLALINTAEENDVPVDNFVSILENATTVEAVEAAIVELKVAIIAVLGDGASEDNPVNVTSIFLVNPDFQGKSTQGWTLTGAYAKTQNNSPHPIEEGEGVGEEGLDTGGWLEFWKSGGIDAAQDAHQVVSDLPAGSYRLQLVGVGQGGKLYAITNGIRQENTIPTQKVQRLSFDFVHIGGDLTLGFDFNPPAGNTIAWVAVDKFRLYYLGTGESPTVIIMRNALKELTPYVDAEDEHIVGQALMAKIEDLNKRTQDLISSNSEDEALNTAVISEIQAMVDSAALEAKAYQTLEYFVGETLFADEEYYEKMAENSAAYKTLYDKISGEWDELANDAFSNRTWSKAEIEAFMAEYNAAIETAKEGRKAEVRATLDDAAAKVAAGNTLEEPIDITGLYNQLTFPSAKTLAKNLEDKYNWNWTQYQEFNGNDGLKFEYHTAEGWSSLFDANTVVANLPKGKYVIKVNAFYRPMGTDLLEENYDGSELAFFYANNGVATVQKPIINWDELLEFYPNTTEMRDVKDDSGNITGQEEVTIENRPNSQQAANKCFTGADEKGAVEKTTIEVPIALREAGSLTIGAKDLEGVNSNCWVVWSDITLLYVGAIDSESQALEIDGLIAEAEALKEEMDLTAQAITNLDDAITVGAAALQASLSEQVTAIEQLKASIDYAKNSIKLIGQLIEVTQDVRERITAIQDLGYVYDGIDYESALDEAENGIDNYTLETNEQVEGYINTLKDGWYDYILTRSDLADATEDNPVDISELMVNYDFKSNNKNGWTVVQEGNAGGDGNGCAEFWGASTFNMYQQVGNLKDGYWRLSVDALYRYGGTASEVNALKADTARSVEYLYINTIKKPIMLWSNTNGGAFTEENVPTDDEEKPIFTKYPVEDVEGVAPFYTVNDKAGFENMLAEGRYHNQIVFAYGEGIEGALKGKITLGLRKDEKPSVDNDWCPFDNFKLEYLGTTAPTNEEVVDGIQLVNNATGRTAVIFSIDGRQQRALRRGFNIVRTQEGNVHKVLVK